jgi:Leucine-rich repeat (LRR) protein
LFLYGTRITGHLDANSFAGTSNLRKLHMSAGNVGRENMSSGPSTNFFSSADIFKDMNLLEELRISSANNVIGNLPTLTSNTALQILQITGTQITGGIPTFQTNSLLREVELQSNNLSGGIPDSGIYQGNSIEILNLSDNNLSGDIQDRFAASSLRTLNLSDNSFESAFPDFSNCANLQEFNAENNKLSGYTPGSLLNNTKLTKLQLNNNKFTPQDGTNMINDIYDNAIANPGRATMDVRLENQAGLSEFSVNNDGTGTGPDSTTAKLQYLRGLRYSIILTGSEV